MYFFPFASVICVLFWQAIADGEGEEEDVVLDMAIVLLCAVDPDMEVIIDVMLPPARLEDVEELVEATRSAATCVLSELVKANPAPFLTKHWPDPAPLALPA